MSIGPTVVIADDHPLFRGALRQTVEATLPGAAIVEAGTLDEVAEAIAGREEVDLVLFDLAMPGARGFSGLVFLRAAFPGVPVCVVSGREDADTIRAALALGAAGFIPKSSGADAMRRALRAILAGGEWSPDLAPARPPPGNDPLAEIAGRLRTLTPQQVRVLMMLREGLLNKEIAWRLGVSEATVKAHVSAILGKLHVANRTRAVLVAGLIETGEWAEAGG